MEHINEKDILRSKINELEAETMKLETLRMEVKVNFFKLYNYGLMTKDLAERLVVKAEKMEQMELEAWHNDTVKEIEKKEEDRAIEKTFRMMKELRKIK